MKEGAEFINLSIIYTKNIKGSKSDFARLCGYPERNKEFRNWLDNLINTGLLVKDSIGDRKNIIIYKTNRKNILKFIKSFKNFQSMKRMFYDHYEGPFRY
jgi:hypothetical protein